MYLNYQDLITQSPDSNSGTGANLPRTASRCAACSKEEPSATAALWPLSWGCCERQLKRWWDSYEGSLEALLAYAGGRGSTERKRFRIRRPPVDHLRLDRLIVFVKPDNQTKAMPHTFTEEQNDLAKNIATIAAGTLPPDLGFILLVFPRGGTALGAYNANVDATRPCASSAKPPCVSSAKPPTGSSSIQAGQTAPASSFPELVVDPVTTDRHPDTTKPNLT